MARWRRCMATGCRERIPNRFLMCRPHWRLLGRDLRHIWAECCRDYAREPSRDAHDVLAENLAQVLLLLERMERML